MTICKYWFELYFFVNQRSFSTLLKLLDGHCKFKSKYYSTVLCTISNVRRILKRGVGTSENLKRKKVGMNIVSLQFSPIFGPKLEEDLPQKKTHIYSIFLGAGQKHRSSPTISVLKAFAQLTKGAFRNFAY